MGRTWTHEERKKHIRRKYYTWKEKVLVVIISMISIFAILGLLASGFAGGFAAQIVSVALIVIVAILIVLVVWGGEGYHTYAGILAAVAVLLAIAAAILLTGSLSGLEQILAYLILGIAFLVVVAGAAFFIDMMHYESI